MKLRTALGAIAPVLAASLFVADARAATFPTWPADASWVALSTSSGFVYDSSTDGPGSGGGNREIVGETNPAVYIYSDGAYIFMRIRLDATPVKSAGSYVSFGWGCEVNVYPNATNTYQWLLQVDGTSGNMQVEQNTAMASLDSPGSSATGPVINEAAWNGTSSGFSRTATSPTSYNDSSQDTFIDFAVPFTDLTSSTPNLTITTSTPIRFLCGTSSSTRSLTGDLAGTSSSTPTISGNVSIPYVCNASGCSACNTTNACGPSCAACSGATPACGGSTVGCVQCASSSDCTTSVAPYCNTTTHTCGPCIGDGPAGGCLSSTKPACAQSGPLVGSCQQCSSTDTAQCTGSTPVCNTTTDTCVQCTSNASCGGSTPVCNTTTNKCVQCTSSASCGGTTPVCNTSTDTCAPCTADGAAGGCTDPTKPACITSGALAGSCQQCSSTNLTQCTGASPTCNTTTDTCVSCTSDANCSGATPKCNTATNTCVACTGDGVSGGCDNPLKPACITSGSLAGTCQQCSSTNGALCTGATPTCNTTTDSCVACTSNANCSGSTPVCNTANDTCVACLSNSDCSGATPYCNVGTHTCGPCTADGAAGGCADPSKPACISSGPLAGTCQQCSAGNGSRCGGATPICNTTTDTCVQCTSSASCSGNTPVCNTSTDTCGACTADGAAGGCTDPTKPACITTGGLSGSCQQCSTTNTSQCGGVSPVCNTTTGTCASCISNANCSGTTPVCNTTNGTCGPCTGDGPAGGCTDPSRPACQTSGALAGSCTPCSSTNTAVCTAQSQICDTPTGTCVQCETDANCPVSSPKCNTSTHTCGACTGDGLPGGCTDPTKLACQTTGSNVGTCQQCSASDTVACTGGTPICNTGNGACVQCLANTDCPASNPVCNPAVHQCGGCTGDGAAGGCADPTKPACVTGGPLAGTCQQCSTTNGTLCTGTTPKCNTTTDTCAQCLANADCPASAPVCNAGVCSACTADGAAGGCPDPTKPACVTSGPNAGTCQQCSSTNGTQCTGQKPLCDSTSDTCVQCRTNTDCPASTPVCNAGTHTCGGCTGDGAAGGCPDPTKPACVTSGPGAGTCAQCSATNTSQCPPTSPACEPNNTCGCDKDTQCGGANSGEICNGNPGQCVAGCHPNGGNGCPSGEQCNAADGGTAGTCVGEPCNTDTDCTMAPLNKCDTSREPHVCVQCTGDNDCKGRVCNTGSKTCQECTPQNPRACTVTGNGAACLANGNCGCANDSDCGGATSGRVCDPSSQKCTLGCRGSGGNACPSTQQCSSTGSDIGQCASITPGPGVDAGAPANNDQGSLEGGGCSCTTAGSDNRSSGFGGLLVAVASLGFFAARRRRAGKR